MTYFNLCPQIIDFEIHFIQMVSKIKLFLSEWHNP